MDGGGSRVLQMSNFTPLSLTLHPTCKGVETQVDIWAGTFISSSTVTCG